MEIINSDRKMRDNFLDGLKLTVTYVETVARIEQK